MLTHSEIALCGYSPESFGLPAWRSASECVGALLQIDESGFELLLRAMAAGAGQ